MEDYEPPRDLVALEEVINQLPITFRSQVTPALERHKENTRRRRQILGLVQEALNQLRLETKYLIFDLECTRKERDEARKAVGGDLS